MRILKTTDLGDSILSLQEEISGLNQDICARFPIQAYIEEVKSHRQIRTHSYFSHKRLRIFIAIQAQFGLHALALYHKLALANLMKDSLERLNKHSLPEVILLELDSWFKRVTNDFSTQPDSYYEVSNIDFRYDVGVCCLRSLPVGGAWFIQVRRIGLHPFLTMKILGTARILGFLIFKTVGFTPFCVIHTVPRYVLRFNCPQMNEAYIRIEELMRLNPRIRGVYRRSWFLDPGLKTISPNLGYLREIPEQNGATFFKVASTDHDIRHSLALSPQRKKLYEEGKYMPVPYAYIWPREEFLMWAERHRHYHLH